MRNWKPILLTVTLTSSDNVEVGPILGETRHNHVAPVKIGEALVKSFGKYHRLFGIVVFADCFLHLVTDGTFIF